MAAETTPPEEIERVRQAVARELAHGVRNKLTLLRGYLELALESPAEAEPFLRQALSALASVEALTTKLPEAS